MNKVELVAMATRAAHAASAGACFAIPLREALGKEPHPEFTLVAILWAWLIWFCVKCYAEMFK